MTPADETTLPPGQPPDDAEPGEQPATGEDEDTSEDETETDDAATDSAAKSAGTAGRASSRGARGRSRGRGRKSEPEPDEATQVCFTCGGEGTVPAELQPAADAVRCEGCRGLGMRASGSLIPEHALIPCTDCHGNGYVMPVSVAAAPRVSAPPPMGVDYEPAEPPPGVPLTFPDTSNVGLPAPAGAELIGQP